MNEPLLILGMMLATFGIRYLMFGAISRMVWPPALLNALRYVPSAHRNCCSRSIVE